MEEYVNKRKLVTVRKIDALDPIEGADLIEVATVEGWKLVVKKGEFKVGDPCVYFEIDSFLPDGNPAWQFLVDKSSREFEGVRGHKLRTIKLKGQVSQGLALPLRALPTVQYVLEEKLEDANGIWASMDLTQRDAAQAIFDAIKLNGDIRAVNFSDLLGVKKFEAPLPACLQGQAAGLFPSFLRKTDQERCVSGNTLVTTELGDITISELCNMSIKPLVLSFNHNTGEKEFKQVNGQSIMPPGGKWLKITTKSGKTLIVTDNHRIWCEDVRAYRLATELVLGQKILT